MEKFGKYITLDKYKIMVREFWKRFKSILVDAANDEVYHVSNTFRNDLAGRYIAEEYSGLYKKYSDINDMIYRAEDNIEGVTEDEDEYLGEFHYWTISKYKQINDGYELLFSVYQTFIDGYLEVCFQDAFLLYANDKEKELYNQWQQLSRFGKERINILLPYKKSEIIEFDGKPATTDVEYYICLGDGEAIKRNGSGMLCVVDLQWPSDIRGFKQLAPSYFKIVCDCPDVILKTIADKVKNGDEEEVVASIRRSMYATFNEQIAFNNSFSERIISSLK